MKTLLVYESLWGNTKTVAETIAHALDGDVTLVEAGDAPTTVPPDIDLLVVGGPTHAFSMSRPSTRQDAETKGADYIDREKAKRDARRNAEELYDQHYGGQDQYDPNQQQPHGHLQESFGRW